jgi:hypothetical protein
VTAPEPCDSCGRRLTDPQSIARRLGPHCWRKEHPAAPTPGRSDDRAGPDLEDAGQLALAIQPPLPTGDPTP